ncbi:MAG: hypothetical protein C0594_14330 [Marinilabiliales bacterium]|nr:MAG: hypothetical protein C0594_14330 [Marinilabiliales bacterium]
MRKFTLIVSLLIASVSINCWAGNPKIKLTSNESKIEVLQKSETGFTIQTSIKELSYFKVKTPEGSFIKLVASDFTKGLNIGNPDLPSLRKLCEIPQGANISVQVVSYDEELIDLNEMGIDFPVIPAQPSISKSEDAESVPFYYNASSYELDEFAGNETVICEETGTMRGVKVGRITISPFSYNPVTNQLKVKNNLVVEVRFKNADVAKTRQLIKKLYSPYFDAAFSKFLNYGAYHTKDVITTYPVKYVIVSDPMFETTLQPFIQWKTQKGFNVIEAYTDDAQVGNTLSSIHDYLQGLYTAGTTEDPPPTYVLFVGDVAQIPAYDGNTGSHVSDMYYCEFDGGGDYYPEIYYGRFSAETTAELQVIIDKTLQYELYTMPDPSYLDHTVLVAGVDGSMAPTYGNGQIGYASENYFNAAHDYTAHVYLYGSGTPITSDDAGAADAIHQDVSNGAGFVNYTAHCDWDGWSDPSFNLTDIPNLTNTDMYCVMIGNCCLSNKFDENDCFGETMLKTANKGAVGYIGGSNSTLWDEDFYWSVGATTVSSTPSYDSHLGAYDCAWHENGEAEEDWFITNAQILFAGNLAVTEAATSNVQYYWEIYHLMGDPSLMTYFTVPSELSATYMDPIPVGTSTLDVTTEPGAYVAISQNYVLLDAKIADASGVASLEFDPFVGPGSADVVATMQNRSPYIGTVDIVSANTQNDAQLSNIIIPESNHSILYPDVVPTVVIRNLGMTDLTEVEVGYEIDGGTIVSESWTGTLAQYETDTVYFAQITLTSGSHTVTAFTSWPNGVEDEFHPGDTISKVYTVTAGDAELTSISGFEEVYCDVQSVTPVVTITNKGDFEITSLDVSYQIDGGSTVTENWSGNLQPNASEQVSFPTTTLTPGSHTLNAFTNNPNGGMDENTGNDEESIAYVVYENAQIIELSLTTDDYGSETTWDFVDDATSNVLYSGGPYSDWSSQTFTETFCLGEGCYTFTIYDSYGDGLDGYQNDGSYSVTNTTSSELMGSGGGNFGSSESVNFCIVISDIDNYEMNLTIYPNPAKDILNIQASNEIKSVTFTDMLGNIVLTESVSSFNTSISTEILSSGVYFVTIEGENSSVTQKIIITD